MLSFMLSRITIKYSSLNCTVLVIYYTVLIIAELL